MKELTTMQMIEEMGRRGSVEVWHTGRRIKCSWMAMWEREDPLCKGDSPEAAIRALYEKWKAAQ